MSSHHIVRDEQEPAIVLMDRDYNQEILNALLEWSPQVLTTYSIFQQLESLGIKADVVLGDDAERQQFLQVQHSPGRFILQKQVEDSFETAMYYLAAKKYAAVHVFVPDMDSLVKVLSPSFYSQLQLIVFTGNKKWVYKTGTFKKWYPEGDVLYVKGAFATITFEESEQRGTGSSFEVPHDGFVTVKGDGFWLGETL